MPAHSVKFDEQDHEKIKGDDALSGSYEESALSTILKKKQLLKQSRGRGEGREGGERERGQDRSGRRHEHMYGIPPVYLFAH